MKRTRFHQQEIEAFEPAEKIGLVSSINPEGKVHTTLITSIMASTPTQLTLGQFCTGLSKWYMQENNKVSFLIMTLDRKMWRGKARWTHRRFDGPEYDLYNETPMFRYNTYFGINTVHYLDLVETTDEESLPLGKIVPASLLTSLAKGSASSKQHQPILKPFAVSLFNQLSSLKFISWVSEDGFPSIVPIIQCQAADSSRLVFSPLAYGSELESLKAGSNVTVFCVSMNMQSVLIRGQFNGYRRFRFLKMGSIDIDWVYNSMPPNHQQIYPEIPLEPVVNF